MGVEGYCTWVGVIWGADGRAGGGGMVMEMDKGGAGWTIDGLSGLGNSGE